MKGRKLTFDDHTGSFIAESRIEALERTCRQRERQAQTMNRGEKVVLDSRTNQIKGSYNLFTMKTERERDTMREGLKDKVAYRSVLGVIGQLNERDPSHNPLYGKYGPETTRIELAPLVEAEMKMMSPAAKRKQKAGTILDSRKKLELFDRRSTTSALMRVRLQSRLTPDRPIRTRESLRRGKLILPPIQASKSPILSTPNKEDSIVNEIDLAERHLTPDNIEQKDADSLPGVFVTTYHKEFTR